MSVDSHPPRASVIQKARPNNFSVMKKEDEYGSKKGGKNGGVGKTNLRGLSMGGNYH